MASLNYFLQQCILYFIGINFNYNNENFKTGILAAKIKRLF